MSTDTNEQMQIMLQRKVSELQQENELMRQLGTTNGFFQAYFNMLKLARTNEEAFQSVNEQYFVFFGEYRYADHISFKSAMRYLRKNNRIS